MGERLSGEDFNNLFKYFQHTAFRLEVQPVYLVEDEQEQVAAFLAGSARPPTEFESYAAWLQQIRTLTAEGKRIGRVRVLTEPPTDYLRWEAWAGQWNITAGEDIRYIASSRANEIGLPLDYDWWLFDSLRLAVMKFDPDGRPLGGEIITDPAIVVKHGAWRDLAIHHSAPAQGLQV
jgi:hypothetical protein